MFRAKYLQRNMYRFFMINQKVLTELGKIVIGLKVCT